MPLLVHRVASANQSHGLLGNLPAVVQWISQQTIHIIYIYITLYLYLYIYIYLYLYIYIIIYIYQFIKFINIHLQGMFHIYLWLSHVFLSKKKLSGSGISFAKSQTLWMSILSALLIKGLEELRVLRMEADRSWSTWLVFFLWSTGFFLSLGSLPKDRLKNRFIPCKSVFIHNHPYRWDN